jgi:hypothetical protein
MDSPLDSLRTKVPWMKDLSDDEILLKASEITGKPVHDIADYYGVTTGVDRNALSAGLRSGWEDIKGLGYSAAAAGADIVGAKDTRDWLNKQADKRQAASQIESRPDLENVENIWSEPSKWGPYGIYQIGKHVPNLAAGIGTGLLVPEVAVPAWLARGAAVGPKVLGMGGARAGMSYAEREAAIKAGQTFGKQVVGGGAFNEAQSLGSLYQEAVDAGRPEASGESLLKSIPYAISETGPEAMLAGRFLHGSGLKGNIARRMGISGAIQGASGATSEAIQNELEMSMHPEGQLTPEQIASRRLNSPVAGGLVEGVLGSFGGVRSHARAPISTTQPADLTKRLPDEAYDAQVERMHGMESGALGIRTPEEQSAFVQKQAERDLLGGLYPPAAPAAPTYGTDYADQLAQAHGMPPGSFSPIVAPVAPAAVKPKAAANAARDAAAAPVDPVIAQITEVKNQLRDPYIESHLPADHTKTPGQIHQAITRLVGDPQTMDEAAATLKGKIAAVLTPGQGKGSKVERTARAEKMIQFYDNIVGTPDAERMTAEQWEENLKAESAAAAAAAAVANAKVGEAGKLPGAVTTIDPNAVATPPTTPSTAATAAPTPPGVPPKPTNPAELPAYQAAITPHLLAGVLPGELQALQLVHRVNAENAGDTEAAAASLRAAAKESGIPHTTLADRANRGLAKIEANATKVGLPVEAAQALLGMETSLDMADVATPTTGYEGQGRVVTAPSEEFEPEAGYAREETAAQEGEALPEEGAAEGEAAPEVAVEAAPRAEFENKWVDAQGQPISHADVQDAAEDYGNHEMGYAAGDPKWEQLSPKLQLQWVRGYLAAYTMYPKSKQVEERRKFTDVVRTAMAEGEEQPSEATPRDTGTEGADAGARAGPNREAEKGPDDAGAAKGVGREVGTVPAADAQADTGRVPPAGTAGEKVPVAGEAGKGAEAAPVVKRKRKVVVEKPAETKPTETAETKPAETKPAEIREAPKEAPTTTEAAGRTVREVRARRQWLDAYEREPAIGKWDELSKKSQEEFIAANDDEQSFDDVVDIKLADPSGEVLQKALAEKEKAAKAKKAPAEKTTESADERAERKWGELHTAVPQLGPWNELTPEGRQEFTALPAKKQNVGSAEQVKTKDERWKGIQAEGKKGPSNMLSAMEDVAATGGVNAVRMANLMGSQLYGKMNDIGPVTIKELFQNAFDALKGAMEKGGRDHGNISVDLNEDARTITVKDDGTGMTADTINNAFLTLAGTNKETDRPSGSFGVAKMLFLFGNKSLKLVTVRNGIESTLETTGAKQLAAFHDPSKAVPIKRQKTDKSPGTTITIELPETYREENVDKPIKFPERWQASSILNDSPLFENITVRLNGDEMRIGKNFPKDEYTVLTVAKFPWGKVRVLVAPVEYAPFENASVLSNGVIQFNEKITKDPSKPYSGSVPYRFFFNVEPSVKADAPDYPFALNRQGISLSAKNDFEVLQKYINIMYANTASEANSQSFGVLSQFDEDGTSEKKIDLNVPTAKPGTTLKIDKNDKVEIRDGRMYINNRAVPELTKEQMKAMQHDPTQFRVDQSKLDPDLAIVHDNVLLNDKPYLEEARRELGDKPVNDYLLGVSRVFKQLRDAAKKVGGKAYEGIDEIPVGVSIDTKYYGVNTMIPFRAMMLNPTVTKGGEIKDAANIIVGTMIHELAHHAERNHSETGFIPELQRLFVVMAQSRDMSKAIANLQRVIDANAQVYNYFIKEQDSGNLKNRGIRLESGAQVIEGEGAADRTAEPSGGGRDAGDGTGLYQAVGTGNQNRPAGQGRAGAPATNATRAAKAAGTKHLTNVTTFAKTHGLGFMITEDIADLAAHNGLPEVRTYVDAAKTREGERVRFEQPVGRIAEQYDALPQHERGIGDGSVNKFIHDATVKGSLDGIKRFSAAGQKLINDVFQHGKDTLALKKKLIEQEVGREYDTRIKAETDPAKQDELRKEKKLLLSRYSKLMTIKNSDTYAPLKRFGDYVVSVKSAEYVNAENNNDKEWISENQSDPNHYQVHFAESQGEADALAESLKPQFAGGKLYAAARDADIRNQHDLFRAFPVLMTRLREEFPMQGGKVSPMERIIRDLYLQALAENSARKNEMRRRGITGASTDMIRSFVTQGRADASFLANLKHNDALQNAVQGMRNGAERDPRNLTPYLNEMLQRHAASYETQSADWANKIKRTTSIWLLATNPTYYLQQLVQPTSMSHPVIAGQQGWWRTGRALAKGYSDMMPLIKGTDLTGHIDWNTAPADVRDVLTTLANNGAIDVTNTMDQGEWETAGAKSKAGAVWNRIDRRLRGLNTRVEALNRSVTAAAAYRLELARNGGDKAVATRYAEAMVRQTHGSYDGSNTPRYLQGTYKGLLTQFRRFQIIQISLIARLAHTAFKGANAVERGIARRALTYTLLHTAAIGGTLGMPGAALLTSLIARLFGPSDEPPDFEKLAREAIDDQTISDLLLKGVPAMLGVDLSSKFGMGNMLSINAFSDFPHDRKSFQDYVFGSLGPTVGMGAKAADGAALMYKGDVAKGAELLLPSGFANAMKGYRIGTEGVSLRKGDTVLAPEELGFADALLQGLGMPTTTITHQQRLSQTKYEFDTYYKDRANELIHDYQQARKDGESTADVIADWQNLQEGRVRNGYTRQPLSFLLKSAQMQMKRERGTAGGVEFTKANKRFVQEQAGL